MLVNSGLTVYHKYYDETEKLEKWERFNYDNVWWFGGKGAGINKRYENANDVQIRIFYETNKNLDIENFSIGDILIQGLIFKDINTQQELDQENIYNITSLNNNTFGNNPHIHIGGK